MSLLPKITSDFGSTEYWNNFFRKRGKQAFEWYGEYPELCGQLHKYIKTKDELLVVGCGNSKLSVDLYDVGYRKITNIDISAVVIKQMQDANRTGRPEMLWQQMDATAMSFADETYSVVLDKGTLDALFTDESVEVCATVEKYFSEIGRVLRVGGRYVCVSLLQEHILRKVVNHFPSTNFMLRIVRCPEAERRTAEANADGTSMPVFVVVATKFKNLPMKVLEMCMAGDQIQRVQSGEEIIGAIQSAQKASMVCNGLVRGNIAGFNEVTLELFRPGETIPRYTFYVLDQKPIPGNGKYAAFIVPQGKEKQFVYSTPAGRQKLLGFARHDRLAIVTLHRGQQYKSLELVKDELSESVKSLAPVGLTAQIPFLSIGEDLGHRETIHAGKSELSGDYVVEEIIDEKSKTLRHLVFLSNPSVVQSAAAIKLARVKGQSRQAQKVVDHSYIASQYHLYMTVGVHLATKLRELPKSPSDALVVGLGGGGLCTLMNQCLKTTTVTAVEIDPEIQNIAVNFFGLTLNNRLKVHIQDGLEFLSEQATKTQHYDTILFDVDSKDLSVGMSCPPKAFLEQTVLADVHKLLGANGMFVLNLVCRNDALREQVIEDLKHVFKYALSYKMQEDELNEVFYCTDSSQLASSASWQEQLKAAAEEVNGFAQKERISRADLIDLDDFVKTLKI